MKNLLIFIGFLIIASSIPTQDIVTFNIVGYNYTWYSGYLQFNTGKYHYVYFESQRDPQNDPITWWFNGGPGCSSMLGLFYQNGPFVFTQNTYSLKINNNSWNKVSNMLYIQTPGGVGFSKSYRDNKVYSDQTASNDNLKALLKFYQKFPTLKKNQLYITGQSYAGVYIPFLSRQILQYNKTPRKQMNINLKGIMINNACTDHRECYQPRIVNSNSVYQYQYLYDHGYITDGDYLDFTASCLLGYYSEDCYYLRQRLDTQFKKTNTSIYNIYKPCFYQKIQQNFKLSQSGKKVQLADGLTCEDQKGYLQFLNEPFMHVHLHTENIKFQSCNQQVSSRYMKNPQQSYPLYPGLINQKLRIWITSGDHDADVPITGTLTWIKRLREQTNMPIQQPWRQWWVKGMHKHQDQVGGMVWTLRGLTFASIRGAGHMAHKDKKEASLTMLKSFLKGEKLPYQEE